MMFKRFLYFGYYLKRLDSNFFLIFLNHTSRFSGKSKSTLILDILFSVFRYNISILEYFQFRFFEKTSNERALWAGTGFMFEFQRFMNPLGKREVLNDKTRFYKTYKPFFIHTVADKYDLINNPELVHKLLNNPSGKIVFKEAEGKCGIGVRIVPVAEFQSAAGLVAYMNHEGFDLVEEFILQHPLLNELSPSAVNTVRIFTQLTVTNEVVFLACRQRISVNSQVDNMAAGNVAAPVDEHSGIISGPAVYSDITKPPVSVHPVTGVTIVGFQIPFWEETKALVKKAALHNTENRSIGWDIVITKNGPGLIEGNHDWCKLVYQLPDHTGRIKILQDFLNSYKEVNLVP